MNYYVWETKTDPGYCVLEDMENFEDSIDLSRGIECSDRFPDDALFRMDSDFRKEVKLSDLIGNIDSMLVASSSLADFLKQKELPKTEFLRVSIINHKDRLANDDYWVVNSYNIRDCIDKENSKLMWNKIDPELLSGIYKLILKPDSLEDKPIVFRPKHAPTLTLIREDLVKEIEQEGFSGPLFTPVDKYIGG